jgi:hypothetical protein
LEVVNHIEPNRKLYDNPRKYELEEYLGVSGRLVSPDSTNRAYFTDNEMGFYSYSGEMEVQLPFSSFILEVISTL